MAFVNPFTAFMNSAKSLVTKRDVPGSTFNSFMVSRILSMDTELLPFLTKKQSVLETLDEKRQQILLSKLLPRKNSFYVQYIGKGKKHKTKR